MAGDGTVAPPQRRRRRPSSWSEIPEELLMIIFKRISDWSDLYQCLGVCPLWRTTAGPVLRRIIAAPVASKYQAKRRTLQFLDLDATTTFCLKSRVELANYTIYNSNSNRGWLLMHRNNEEQEYSLYNPVTRKIVQLPRPPTGPFGRQCCRNPRPTEAELKVFRIHKFVISTRSPRDPNCLVFIWSRHLNRLAFCKPASSDSSFKLTRRSIPNTTYLDMTFYKGELYAVNILSRLYVMKLLERHNEIVVQKQEIVRTEIRSAKMGREFYLVEEPVTEEIMLVEKLKSLYRDPAQPKNDFISKTESFRFFKLKYKYYNSSAATPEWEEVMKFDSDHHALRLVSGDSMFVSALGDQTRYKPNCIYFVDEFYNSDPLNYVELC